MPIDPLPPHVYRPHLRPIQPVPVQKDGKQFVALRDPTMLMKRTMVVPVQALQVLQRFRGQQSLDELAEDSGNRAEQLAELAQGLDSLGLLWGPTFERLEAERWQELEQAGAFPVRATQSLGEDAAACRTKIEEYFDQTEDPELDDPPRAVVAPHLDYDRGWPNYAAAYYGLRSGSVTPDRVVILGSNHFGIGDGAVLTQLGFETPMGRSPADTQIVDRMVEKLGRPIIADQLDHLAEHSIELQVPWVQRCFGEVPIVAALIPDPLAEMIADDGQRVPMERFVEALRESLDEAGGETFFVASADLSHVGPQFGEPRPVDEQRRIDVEQIDRDMMGKYLTADVETFLGAFRWNRNPTRWCSVGNMAATLMLTEAETIELIDYRQACDERGQALVSSAAMVIS
jgi:hypothetical protein